MPAGAQSQQNVAVQRAFAHGMVAVVGAEDVAVGRHGNAVGAGKDALAPGLKEVAVLVEHNHRVVAAIEGVHVVVGVATHGGHLPEGITGGQLAPALLNFVGELTFSNSNHWYPSCNRARICCRVIHRGL